ncbi:hypothetical protein RFI_28254, partial [Reticulomyxa filosa]
MILVDLIALKMKTKTVRRADVALFGHDGRTFDTATMTDYSIGMRREELDPNVRNFHSVYWTGYSSTSNGVNVQSGLFQTTAKESDAEMIPSPPNIIYTDDIAANVTQLNPTLHTSEDIINVKTAFSDSFVTTDYNMTNQF